MRARDMHPLCCISIDCPGIGDRSPETPDHPAASVSATPPETSAAGCGADAGVVAGVLCKWTNYGRGWRPRWFFLRHGVLSYTKIHPRHHLPPDSSGARLIGAAASNLAAATAASGGRKSASVIYLKISSFRESRSDDRRFYIFSPTKTLHLRTDSKQERVAWIEALVLTKSLFSLDGKIRLNHNELPFSTEKLRERMRLEGLGKSLIDDCEQIMLAEFSDFHKQLKLQYEDQLTLISSISGCQRPLEDVNVEEETTTIHDGQMQLMTHFSSSGHGKYSEYSTTESSDDIEKQDLNELSDEDEPSFFDTKEVFGDCSVYSSSMTTASKYPDRSWQTENCLGHAGIMSVDTEYYDHHLFSQIERRKKLPDPVEKEKSVSLWSIIKTNIGKDLTRVCLPVYFNEPLSSLQKCCEELEYSYLLDRAYEFGKAGNSLMRLLNVAAFAVSGYASSDGRLCKPFNPLLGETFEADFPERGFRFFSEKVSHHPMLIACHSEGKGWKFWGDTNLQSKFWGQSIQLEPVGILTLEFDDGEIFQWNKVTTTIYNLVLGKVSCGHHGIMNIKGNREYSCKLKFKEQSLLERNPRQVQGFVEDVMGSKVAMLMGKWDDSMYYAKEDDIFQSKDCHSTQKASLLWKRSKALSLTRYNLSSFAITLNELTSELQEKLPPTDSRLRPDQRYLENGEYEKANAEKQRLEKRQRMSRKLQETWKPRWFHRESENGTYQYVGGYWEAREQQKWDGCLDIFGEFSEDAPQL